VTLGILQHPTEVAQVKGTAKIAELSFQKATVWVGESLDDLPELQVWLQEPSPVFLLYPEIEGQSEPCHFFEIDEITQPFKLEEIKVLVLDGTWRKTHKMMMLNSALRALNRVVLSPRAPSDYRIRKQKGADSLATIEAIYELYSQLEGNTERYQPLLTAFEAMQAQQLRFRQP
jgi:DTW domain-containing protein YfiP